MEAALIVAIIFGSLTLWVRAVPAMVKAARSGGRRGEGDPDAQRELGELKALAGRYEERLRTLETIVCDVDYQLNKKLSRLATQPLLPAQGAAGQTGELQGQESPSGGVLRAGVRVAERFVIEDLLGAGAMGEVYRARDETLGETVALKVMAGVSLLDREGVERFKREAAAARRITHENVVRMHDIGVDRGVHFISMQYVQGESLAQRLTREGALSLSATREITSQICDALQAAHAADVIHRDLKPGNILLDTEGRVRVIDFGVARLPAVAQLTATGVVMGTPEFMAPEQIKGLAVDQRTDLYALGALVFHMLTGGPPFRGESPIAIGIAHCTEPIPDLDEYRDAPPGWNQLLQRALAKDPGQRFPDARSFQQALPQ